MRKHKIYWMKICICLLNSVKLISEKLYVQLHYRTLAEYKIFHHTVLVLWGVLNNKITSQIKREIFFLLFTTAELQTVAK